MQHVNNQPVARWPIIDSTIELVIRTDIERTARTSWFRIMLLLTACC